MDCPIYTNDTNNIVYQAIYGGTCMRCKNGCACSSATSGFDYCFKCVKFGGNQYYMDAIVLNTCTFCPNSTSDANNMIYQIQYSY